MASKLNFISKADWLWRNRNVTRDEIVHFRNERVRSLITHAYENVNYYRKLFDDNGVKPEDIKTVNDLSIIPVTNKSDLQLLPEKDLIDCRLNPADLIVRVTSGSSGEPFKIRRTWLEDRMIARIRMRAMRYFGLKSFDKTASVGIVRSVHPRDKQLPAQILQSLGFYRKFRINCLLSPEAILDTLSEFQPDVITGLPGVLSLVAQNISAANERGIKPRFVRVNGEVLTPLMRRQISEAFHCRVFDYYASHEFSPIAWECKETGEYHTCDDGIILEVIKDNRPAVEGERGEVVITNLHSFAMPFIRYKLGDIVTKGANSCPCGQPFSTIRSIQGRMVDYFPLPGGRIIHPFEILYKILIQDANSWIRQYQLIQEREDRIVFRVVPVIAPDSQEIQRLEKSIAEILGEDVQFRVVLVPEIEVEPSGKFRVSRSLVRSAYDALDWNQSPDPL